MNSSSKGHTFEWGIAKTLSLWWSENKNDNIFCRTQSSGARATQRNKSGKETEFQYGDITCSGEDGKPLIRNWNIEAKTGYGTKTADGIIRWDILDFIDSKQKKPALQSMWEQCVRDAEISNKEPILIFRRNRRVPCIMIRTSYEHRLQEWFSAINHASIYIDIFDRCTMMSLSDFFEWIPDIRASLK